MIINRKLGSSCTATALIFALFLAFSVETAGAADKVSLRLDWKIYGTHALFFIGLKKGFYAAEGLELAIKEGNGSPKVVKLMGAGDDTFAFAAGVSTLQGATRGIPVKSIFGIMQRSPLSVMSFKKAGINKPSDLVGKTIATSGGGSGSVLFKTFLKIHNIDPSSIKFAALGIAGRNRALLSGQAHAMVGYSVTDVPKLELKGHNVSVMHFADWKFNTVANGVIINTALEKKSPDTIRKFLRALTKSIEYARMHPKEAADDLGDRFPLKSKEALLKELKWTIGMLETEQTKGKPLGWQPQSEWNRTQSVLLDNKIIEKKLPLGEVFTNSYVPN